MRRRWRRCITEDPPGLAGKELAPLRRGFSLWRWIGKKEIVVRTRGRGEGSRRAQTAGRGRPELARREPSPHPRFVVMVWFATKARQERSDERGGYIGIGVARR